MRQHLFRVTRGAEAFAALIRALAEAGCRAGWLELAAPSRLPEELEEAAGLGVLRAVAVGGGRSVAVKPMAGEGVLADLLREHFRGCLLVLLRGEVPPSAKTAVAALEPRGEDWLVSPAASSAEEVGASRILTTDQLITALRKPHPWSAPKRRRKGK